MGLHCGLIIGWSLANGHGVHDIHHPCRWLHISLHYYTFHKSTFNEEIIISWFISFELCSFLICNLCFLDQMWLWEAGSINLFLISHVLIWNLTLQAQVLGKINLNIIIWNIFIYVLLNLQSSPLRTCLFPFARHVCLCYYPFTPFVLFRIIFFLTFLFLDLKELHVIDGNPQLIFVKSSYKIKVCIFIHRTISGWQLSISQTNLFYLFVFLF